MQVSIVIIHSFISAICSLRGNNFCIINEKYQRSVPCPYANHYLSMPFHFCGDCSLNTALLDSCQEFPLLVLLTANQIHNHQRHPLAGPVQSGDSSQLTNNCDVVKVSNSIPNGSYRHGNCPPKCKFPWQ